MKINNHHHYPSRRSPVIAGNMVAASQPLAVQAGLQMYHKGGNAVDAALFDRLAKKPKNARHLSVPDPNIKFVW